jgi:hypothetical protein
LKISPYRAPDFRNPGAEPTIESHQEGQIWQAEEVLKGDKWVRYYGFIGPHTMAKVPAVEIELSENSSRGQQTPR